MLTKQDIALAAYIVAVAVVSWLVGAVHVKRCEIWENIARNCGAVADEQHLLIKRLIDDD